MLSFFIIVTLVVAVVIIYWKKQIDAQRENYIRNFAFPAGIIEKLKRRHPHLDTTELDLVAKGLRQFFLSYQRGGYRFVPMPSQVADDLWHDLILYTRFYDFFCRKAFGRFFHHTPAVELTNHRQSNAGLRRCWRFSCHEENIDPLSPSRLPLLFALDRQLNINNGFFYSADCSAERLSGSDSPNNRVIHCGGDFSSADFDGSTEGFDDSSGAEGGDGCGGGCGGD